MQSTCRLWVIAVLGLSCLLWSQPTAQAASCTGILACSGSNRTIGTSSCNGGFTCLDTANVGNNSCNKFEACETTTAEVGDLRALCCRLKQSRIEVRSSGEPEGPYPGYAEATNWR